MRPSTIVYDSIILIYQERLEMIRLSDSGEYTELYTRFMENVVEFCKNSDLKVDDVMTDIELKK